MLPLLWCVPAYGSEIEIRKQKGCKILLSSSDGLEVGQRVQGQLSSGKAVEFEVLGISKGRAMARLRSRGGQCDSLAGEAVVVGDRKGPTIDRFGFGITGTGGQFTFRQPFSPTGLNATDGKSDSSQIAVNGLSGLGFSAGALIRVLVRKPLNIELGANVLSASANGKTSLPNGDQFTVSSKFLETTANPAVSFSSCISSRLFCKFGGVIGFPITSTLTVGDSGFNETAPLNYLRIGGDLAAGVNVSKSFSIVGGGQISQTKGSFKFSSAADSVNIASLTVYIFGGFVAVF